MTEPSANSTPPTPPVAASQPPTLGIAGRIAQDYIHSPLSPLFFVAMLFMGILGLFFTPRQEDPQISVPMVDIFLQYSGTSTEQVVSLAIDPLQRLMSEIPGVKHVYSATERGRGVVTVEFKVGEKLEQSVFKVHDKIQSNLDKMPPGIAMPLVKPKGIDDVPIVALTLWSEDVDDAALRTLALDVMQNLKEVDNTGASFIVGGRREQVKIEVMPERLSSFKVSLAQVAQVVQTANSELNAGNVEIGNTHFSVQTGAFLQTAHDIEQLVVAVRDGNPVYMRDIATVSQSPEDTQQFVNYFSGVAYGEEHQVTAPKIANGAAAVTIAIAKKINTNGVSVANGILQQVELLKGKLIPDNVHVEVTRNYGKTANDKVNDLIKKLFIATGAVTILVLLTLGVRPAIVVTLVIPVVILITVFSAWILGFTIDRVSLFALIFSIGILVDDAIVVIENIYRRWLLNGQIDTATAVDAVREVGNPTILATFTVVAALLPMGFVSGMMGPYMAPIPALGSVAMIFSLFAAFVFTPYLAMRIRPSMQNLHDAERREHEQNKRLEGFYRKIIPPLIQNKLLGYGFLFSLVFAFFLACSMFYTTMVEVKMLPLDNKPEFSVFVDMNEGTALPITANLVQQMAEKIREIPEVVSLVTYVGTTQPFDFNGMVRHYYLRQQPWQADIHIQLTDKKHRHRSSHEIATETRRMLETLIKGTTARIAVVEMPPGPPVLQSVVAEVYGPDDETRRAVAQHLTKTFEKSEILDDVDNYMSVPYDYWRFVVDTEKAVRLGISIDTVNQNLAMAMGNFKLGDIKKGSMLEPTFIVMQVPLAIRAQFTRLYDLPIPDGQGGTVPLAELGRFVQTPEEPIIYQKDLRRIEYVVGDSVGIYEGNNEYSLSAPIYGMFAVEKLLHDYVAPDGTALKQGHYLGAPPPDGQASFEWTGEWTITYETFRDMGLAFGVAMVLIYILVVWLFGNFLVPAVIMAPIPLTLLGIIPGHWLLGAEFTATSMIGWIALAGIIVRNSILLVDYSIHEVRQGTPLNDAVILACKTRTRPIMITAFALVAGSFVILYDPIFQGMAISLLFGVLVSTLLTLLVIPLGCISVGEKVLKGDESNAPAATVNAPAEHAHLGGTAPHFDKASSADNRPSLWSRISTMLVMGFYLVRMLFILGWMALMNLWQKFWQWRARSATASAPQTTAKATDSVSTPTVKPTQEPVTPTVMPEVTPQITTAKSVDTQTTENIAPQAVTLPLAEVAIDKPFVATTIETAETAQPNSEAKPIPAETPPPREMSEVDLHDEFAIRRQFEQMQATQQSVTTDIQPVVDINDEPTTSAETPLTEASSSTPDAKTGNTPPKASLKVIPKKGRSSNPPSSGSNH